MTAGNSLEQGFTRPTIDTGAKRLPKPPAESTTLVTGATGFIGPHVVRALLDSGRRVVALDVRGWSPEGEFVLGEHHGRVRLELGSVADTVRMFDVVRETIRTRLSTWG